MAFSADELRVLRRALANALHPTPLPEEDVQDCLRLAGSVDEVVSEAGRLRAFLLADLARYREALPGSLSGYLEEKTTDLVEEFIGIVRGRTVNSTRGRAPTPPQPKARRAEKKPDRKGGGSPRKPAAGKTSRGGSGGAKSPKGGAKRGKPRRGR